MIIRLLMCFLVFSLVAAPGTAAPPQKDICPAPANHDDWRAAATRGCRYFGETFQSLGGHSAFAADGSVITCIHFSCRPAPAKPDLTVALIKIDQTVIPYGAKPWTWVHYQVRNIGQAPVNQDVYLRIIKNNAPSSGHIKVSGPIAAGGSKTGKFAVGHDRGWPRGRYQIVMEVDYRLQVDESNERNNLSRPMRFVVR